MTEPGRPDQEGVSAFIAYGIAVALAAIYLHYLLPPGFLGAATGFFQTGDPSQHIAGWLFYAKDAWRFPLLHTDRLNSPEGVSIVFTDSIPLAAVLFKALRSWLPEGFNYFGLWCAGSFVLQAVAATFLIRALGRRDAFSTVAAVLFALSWPALMLRLGHTSLMTHGLILFALAAYFSGRSGLWRSSKASAALTMIILIAMLIHPYLMAMCLAVFVAYLVDQGVQGESWILQALRLGLVLAGMAVLGVVFGYFGMASTESVGFGKYSMNLAAPFTGGLFTPKATDATGGQYEGYNYLGAGGLALVAYAFCACPQAIRTIPRRFPGLSVMLCLLAVYSISNKIYFGPNEILAYDTPCFAKWITGTFRASGRFFWVVGYAALFSALACVLARRSWQTVLLVTALLVVQWIDLGPLRASFMAKASTPARPDAVQWARALSGVKTIEMYPLYGCGETSQESYLTYQSLAAKYGVSINTGYVARAGGDCAAKQGAFEHGMAADDLFVMPLSHVRYHPFQIPAGFKQSAQKGECVSYNGVVLCRAGNTFTSWKELGLDAQPFDGFPSSARWSAQDLVTQIGRLHEGVLIPIQEDAPGYLAFGPHTRLLPGKYRFVLEYYGNAAPSERLGDWTCLLDAFTSEELVLCSGALNGTDGKMGRLEGVFVVEKSGATMDISVSSLGRKAIGVSSFSLTKEE